MVPKATIDVGWDCVLWKRGWLRSDIWRCEMCSALIADPHAHARWHGTLLHQGPPAEFQEAFSSGLPPTPSVTFGEIRYDEDLQPILPVRATAPVKFYVPPEDEDDV